MKKKCAPKIRKKMSVGGNTTYTYEQLIEMGFDDAEATMYLQEDTSPEIKQMLLSKYKKNKPNILTVGDANNAEDLALQGVAAAGSYAATGAAPYAALGKMASSAVDMYAKNEDKDKDYTNLSGEQHALSKGLEYAGYGAAIGTMIAPGVGTGIGALAGGLVGAGIGLANNKKENEKIKALQRQKRKDSVDSNAETVWATANQRSGYNRLAKGGLVKGKGTAKSDSIKASLPEGSFVVPAENAKIAEKLRALYLGEKTKKVKLEDNNGVPVRLSNGEHVFTPEEVLILKKNGIDLNILAPNQDSDNKFNTGGDVKKDKRNFSNPDEVLLKSQEGRLLLEEIEKNKDSKSYLNESSKPIDRFEREGIAKLLEKYKEAVKSGSIEQINDYYDQIKSKGFDPITGKDEFAKYNNHELQKMMLEYDKLKLSNKPEDKIKLKNLSEKIKLMGYNPEKREYIDPNNPVYLSGVGSSNKKSQALKDNTIDEISENDISNKNFIDSNTPQNNSQNKYAKALQAGLSILPGIAQVALAQSQFDKMGERPKYKLDQSLTQATQALMQDSNEGLSEYQLNEIRRNETNKMAKLGEMITASSGGSGAIALSNLRAASLDSNQNLERAFIADQEIKIKKRNMALQALSNLERRKREIFTDELNAFDQNQKAAADLMQAGFHNISGASRYMMALNNIEKANKERQSWLNNIE